ncbi:MAG TPA: hypothetical protein ENN87_12565 [Phycisphaerales bacterium]|nr:hypothetical protein [Phycisphaerales bacterium]
MLHKGPQLDVAAVRGLLVAVRDHLQLAHDRLGVAAADRLARGQVLAAGRSVKGRSGLAARLGQVRHPLDVRRRSHEHRLRKHQRQGLKTGLHRLGVHGLGFCRLLGLGLRLGRLSLGLGLGLGLRLGLRRCRLRLGRGGRVRRRLLLTG